MRFESVKQCILHIDLAITLMRFSADLQQL